MTGTKNNNSKSGNHNKSEKNRREKEENDKQDIKDVILIADFDKRIN